MSVLYKSLKATGTNCCTANVNKTEQTQDIIKPKTQSIIKQKHIKSIRKNKYSFKKCQIVSTTNEQRLVLKVENAESSFKSQSLQSLLKLKISNNFDPQLVWFIYIYTSVFFSFKCKKFRVIQAFKSWSHLGQPNRRPLLVKWENVGEKRCDSHLRKS